MASKTVLNVKIANFVDDKIKDIIEFDGSKVQAREWLNKFYGIYKLKEKETFVIININNKGWAFFEDYVKEGVIIV